jgi:hypothetical protein
VAHAPRRSTFRPTLEALEARWLPSTLTVTSTADSGAGSLRDDIAAAHAGDTINFSSSLAGQTISLTSGHLVINKSLTIQGLGAGQLTVSGEGMSRVFDIAAGANVTVSGLTLSDGSGYEYRNAFDRSLWDGLGGAIFNLGTLTVSSCTISGSSATNEGGGIYNAGTLTVNNGSTLSGDSSYLGGGIFNASNATANVSGCTFSGDSAYQDGGGIYNGGKLTVGSSIFSQNTPNDISGHYRNKGDNTFS